MDGTASDRWVASSLAYLTQTAGQPPWHDATADSERTGTMSEATERTIDPLAILEDLDARRRTLNDVERARYRAAMVLVCTLYPAAKAAYEEWAGRLLDFRTGAEVIIAAARSEEEAGQ